MGNSPSVPSTQPLSDIVPPYSLAGDWTDSFPDTPMNTPDLSSNMANGPPNDSSELLVTSFEQSEARFDFRSRRKGLDMEEQNIRARLEAISKQRERLDADESRHLADLKEAAEKKRQLEERRAEREKKLQELTSNRIVTSLKQASTTDRALHSALQLIVEDQAQSTHFDVIKRFLINELLAGDEDLLKLLAVQVLGDEFPQTQPVSNEPNQVEVSAMPDTAERASINQIPDADVNEPGNGEDVLSDLIEDASPQQVADMIEITSTTPDTITLQEECGTVNDEAPEPFVKTERDESAEPAQPAAKRRKLTEIENIRSTPTPTALTVNIPSRATDTPVTDTTSTSAATPSTHGAAASPTPAPTPRTQKSKAKSTTSTPKRLPAAARRFEKNLQTSSSVDITSELTCQKCGRDAKDPRISHCNHLYCNKCVYQIRSEAKRKHGPAVCVNCNADLTKPVTRVSQDQVDEWKGAYAADEDSVEESGDADDDEDMADEEA